MTASRSDGPTDPAAASRGSLHAPVRRVQGRAAGVRGRLGLIVVTGLTITVVAAGIGLREGDADLPPSPSTSARPSANVAIETGRACTAVEARAIPEIRLESTAGRAGPTDGVARLPDSAPGTPAAWPVPGEAGTILVDPADTLWLTTAGEACIRSVATEYVDAGDPGGVPEPLTRGTIDVHPPQSKIVLERPPEGDWILRVEATLPMRGATDVDMAMIERFFRLTSVAAPGSTPLLTPAVACAALPWTAPVPDLELVGVDGEPVPGVAWTGVPFDPPDGAIVRGTFPEDLELRVVGDACATSWTVEFIDPVSGGTGLESGVDNPAESRYYISQNRIPLPETALGRSVVRASVTFGRGRVAQVAWLLEMTGPPPPAARVAGPDGATAAALSGCGIGWYLADGRSAYESCPSEVVPPALETLSARDGDVIVFDVPGWDIASWWAGCGFRSENDPTLLAQPDGCSLGGFGDVSGSVGPARFLPFPGRRIVSMWVSATRGDDSFSAQYYVEVDVVP